MTATKADKIAREQILPNSNSTLPILIHITQSQQKKKKKKKVEEENNTKLQRAQCHLRKKPTKSHNKTSHFPWNS